MALQRIELAEFTLETGVRLRRLRHWRHMTQETLSEISGVSRAHIRDIERGMRGASFMTAYLLADGLNVALSDLLDW